MANKKNIAVLISGNGTNLQKIIDQCENGSINGIVKIVISNKEDAYGLTRAKNHNIESRIVKSKKGLARIDYDKEVIEILDHNKTDLIVLAGFMRLLSPHFIQVYRQKIINIHPSLLPAFPGLDVQEQAITHGVKYSGATVHFVDEGLDSGPIILQSAVPIRDTDTAETLTEKIHQVEYEIYPKAVELFCDDKLSIDGRRVTVKN